MSSPNWSRQETTGNTIAMRKKTATQTRREFLPTNSTGIVVAGVAAGRAPLWAAENRAGSMLSCQMRRRDESSSIRIQAWMMPWLSFWLSVHRS